MTSCIRKCVSSEDGQNANSVVVVVGADHFEGIKKCYKDVFGESEVEAKVPELLECKDVSSVDSPGLRLAIALRMLGLRCSPDLIDDIMRSLEKDVAGLDNAEKEKFESIRRRLGRLACCWRWWTTAKCSTPRSPAWVRATFGKSWQNSETCDRNTAEVVWMKRTLTSCV